MVSKTYSISNIWLESFIIQIEADSTKALPWIDIVWLPDTTVKEAKERIRSAFKNTDFKLPYARFVVNLSPSDIKKVWNRFDLPIAVAILQLITENLDYNLIKQSIFVWELGLDWKIKRVDGVIPTILKWKEKWFKYFFVPEENSKEASFIDNVNVIAVANFSQLISYLKNPDTIKYVLYSKIDYKQQLNFDIDFADIKWNAVVKRALTIAACGLHNVLMIWWPWTWKTMLAKALRWIMPPMNLDEIMEVSKIYSVNWLLNKDFPLVTKRPFRQVHHTASQVSIVWGWSTLKAGEISLAHKWILFFDELPEFPRQVLEVLRQPLEDRYITISRVSWSTTYPAHFMFVAAMNPCKCWYYKDPDKTCNCTFNEIKRYQSKISWPLLDRFDIIIEVPKIKIEKLLNKSTEESSEKIRQIVTDVWQIQNKRFENENISVNSQMQAKHIDKYCVLTEEAEDFIKTASVRLSLSARSVHRIIKFSRTVADINKHKNIQFEDIAESLQYRSKNMLVEM